MQPRGTFWIYQSGDSLAKEKYVLASTKFNQHFQRKKQIFCLWMFNEVVWSQRYIRALPDMRFGATVSKAFLTGNVHKKFYPQNYWHIEIFIAWA